MTPPIHTQEARSVVSDTDTHLPEEPPERRPFAALITEHRNGALHDECSTELQALVAAVMETGKKGTLVLKLTVAQADDETMVVVTGEVATKVPKHDPPVAFFWPDSHGNLLRRDPRQPQLPLKEINGGRTDNPTDLREAK